MTSKALRTLALISMLCDHAAAVFLEPGSELWMVLRSFGRLAFPIFCFLLVEGFMHTHSLKKYVGRMALFALLSEIPYDLAFEGKLHAEDSNVFVTLLLGLVMLAAVGRLSPLLLHRLGAKKALCDNRYMQALAVSPIIVGICHAADFLLCDYGCFGILVVLAFYLFRDRRVSAFAAFALLNWGMKCVIIEPPLGAFFGRWYFDVLRTVQWFAPLACIPLGFYNGKPGSKRGQWLFYVFYPAHLLIIGLISLLLSH